MRAKIVKGQPFQQADAAQRQNAEVKMVKNKPKSEA